MQNQKEKTSEIEKIKELLSQKLLESNAFMLTFHYVEEEQLKSFLFTNEFPNGDLGKVMAFVEDESVKILKCGASGNGRRPE